MSALNQVILSIAPTFVTRKVYGVEKNAFGPIDALSKMVKVVCLTDTRSTIDNQTFQIEPLLKKNAFRYVSFKNYKHVLNKVRQLKPNSILLEQPFLGLITYWVAKQTNTPYFVHAHNIEYLRFKSLGRARWMFIYLIEKFTLKNANGVFFVTKFDKDIAIKKLKLDKNNCFVTPYGVPNEEPIEVSVESKKAIRDKHNIGHEETMFMFFGVLKYMPNIEALEIIIEEILPRLKKNYAKKFKIIVCGAGISEAYKQQLENVDKDCFIYAGFVDDINAYIQASDVIMIPVLNRGGIKIRIIEALGFNKNVVSTTTGAMGVDPEHCGTKLYIAADNNWDRFTEMLIEATENDVIIPKQFFDFFSWNAVAKTMLKNLSN